jgi:hypothetical protein
MCFSIFFPFSFSFFFLFAVLGLELGAYTLSHSTSPFVMGFFRDRISQTICLGWLQTNSPDLCLLNNKDYSCEPLASGCSFFF